MGLARYRRQSAVRGVIPPPLIRLIPSPECTSRRLLVILTTFNTSAYTPPASTTTPPAPPMHIVSSTRYCILASCTYLYPYMDPLTPPPPKTLPSRAGRVNNGKCDCDDDCKQAESFGAGAAADCRNVDFWVTEAQGRTQSYNDQGCTEATEEGKCTANSKWFGYNTPDNVQKYVT